jgi:hypothetical protein
MPLTVEAELRAGVPRRRVPVERRVRRAAIWAHDSEQFAKLLDGKPRIADNTAHRYGVDRIVARNGQYA